MISITAKAGYSNPEETEMSEQRLLYENKSAFRAPLVCRFGVLNADSVYSPNRRRYSSAFK